MEIHLQNKEVPHSRYQSREYSKGTRQALSNYRYTRLGIVVNHSNTVPALNSTDHEWHLNF